MRSHHVASRLFALAAFLAGAFLLDAATGTPEPPFASTRARMVHQNLQGRDITDPAVLRAMGRVPRHRFVPAGLQDRAYADRPLPIGNGQTISQPYIVALMTQNLALQPGARVLEIGTGSGYQAAVLAELGAEVFSVEIKPALARQARQVLRELGYGSVQVRTGDGFHGWAEQAPFDAIVVTCAAETIPPPLVAQLCPGGRVVMPLGTTGDVQQLVLGIKQGERLRTRNIVPVRFVPLTRQYVPRPGHATSEPLR